jgi:hypothetical protein
MMPGVASGAVIATWRRLQQGIFDNDTRYLQIVKQLRNEVCGQLGHVMFEGNFDFQPLHDPDKIKIFIYILVPV